jgi:DNA repair exonuclease SbcCD ATPase subunit
LILQLNIRNWRAYDALDLELGPGTTFVVAANGVGKTSLLMAASWGVFGGASDVDAAAERRGSADRASVDVQLRLPRAGDVWIRRSVDARGRQELLVEAAERRMTTDEEFRELLAEELGADAGVLARLTFMTHGGSLQSEQGEFNLQDHLASVFGVGPLLEAARLAGRNAKDNAASLRKFRASTREQGRSREALLSDAAAAEEARTALADRREQAVSRLNDATERRRVAEDWARFHRALDERERALQALREAAAPLLRDRSGVDVVAALEGLEADLGGELAGVEREIATARAEIDVAVSSSAQLGGAGATCPTCLRPLEQHELREALHEHEERVERLRAVLADGESARDVHESALVAVRRVLSQIRSLPVPLRPSEEEVSTGGADAAEYEQARSDLQSVEQELAQHDARRKLAEAALETLAEDERQDGELRTLLRSEAVALAAADAWEATANAITAQRIDPVVDEVGRRWKQVFGSGGLQLSPRGDITREIDGRVLPFKALSGGEKVWALFLTRLLVTAASTRAPFVWLDEPLEHLDPRLRRTLAGTMARATSAGGLRQVVVTTYEAEVARQLMEDVPSASLLYVRAAG